MCLGITGVIRQIRDDDGIPMALIAAGPVSVGGDGPANGGDGPASAAGDGTVSACLLTCPEAAVGDTVLVHSGYVLQILDPDPALREDP
jgi:hydrogenase maturation factor